MTIDRIIVGYDGTTQARGALRCAVHEAGPTGAVVHVVTAWTVDDGRPPAVATVTALLRARQAEAIRAALDRLPDGQRPVVTGSVVMADPVTALNAAAADADLVVIGYGPRLPALLRARLQQCPRGFGGPCPLRVVRTLSTKDIRLEIRGLARTGHLVTHGKLIRR